MSKTDGGLYGIIKSHLEREGFILTRIENRSGIVPDIYFSHEYGNGWIELKDIKERHIRKITKDIKIPYRKGQLSWMIEQRKVSKNIYLIYRLGNLLYYNRNTDPLEVYSVYRKGCSPRSLAVILKSSVKENARVLFQQLNRQLQ